MNLLGVMPAKEGKVKVKSKKELHVPYFCFLLLPIRHSLMQECFLFYDKMLLAQKGLFAKERKRK
jgi:hypothetical protein